MTPLGIIAHAHPNYVHRDELMHHLTELIFHHGLKEEDKTKFETYDDGHPKLCLECNNKTIISEKGAKGNNTIPGKTQNYNCRCSTSVEHLEQNARKNGIRPLPDATRPSSRILGSPQRTRQINQQQNVNQHSWFIRRIPG